MEDIIFTVLSTGYVIGCVIVSFLIMKVSRSQMLTFGGLVYFMTNAFLRTDGIFNHSPGALRSSVLTFTAMQCVAIFALALGLREAARFRGDIESKLKYFEKSTNPELGEALDQLTRVLDSVEHANKRV